MPPSRPEIPSGMLVVIPAYQAAATLGAVLEGIRRVFPSLPVLVVDDGSRDGTAEVARLGGAEVLIHPENRGKGAALKTGFARALERGVSGVVTLDADGQHPPELLPEFLEASADADLVLGCRMGDAKSMPWLRRQTNRAMSLVVSALARRFLRDSQCGYRWISARLLREVPLRMSHYDMESEILVRAARQGFRILEIPIPAVYAGEVSSIRGGVDTVRFLRMVAASL